MLKRIGGVIGVLTIGAAIFAYSCAFTVHQTEIALVVRLGQPIRTVIEPGLYFKIPWIDRKISMNKRILDLEIPDQEIIASDQKRLIVGTFARYRIADALKFYQTLGSIAAAESRLKTLLTSVLRRVLGEASFKDMVRDQRARLTEQMREQLDQNAAVLGLSIVDVRIRSADLPGQNSQAIYRRMQTERQREAALFRAQGTQQGQEIRANANREVTILLAKATSASEQVRGEGDAQRYDIFARAFGKDPDFSSFYRSMQAYENSLKPGTTRLLLNPHSDFFRFFVDPQGKRQPSERTRPR
jgi:membrane protease subunit HflC